MWLKQCERKEARSKRVRKKLADKYFYDPLGVAGLDEGNGPDLASGELFLPGELAPAPNVPGGRSPGSFIGECPMGF